jgi:hypothetical protein
MSQIIQQIAERYKIDVKCKGVKYGIWRLSDTEYTKLRETSLPIKDYNFEVNYHLGLYSDRGLKLAEIMTILEWLLGESSDFYDDWKCGFYFPTLLTITKENEMFYYLMTIYDYRGSIQFHLYKIVDNPPKKASDRDTVRQPFPDFSEEDIKYFTSFFYGYLEGYFEMAKSWIPTKTFIKTIDSNSILYGCKDGKFFEEHYESESLYRLRIKLFKKKYAEAIKKEPIQSYIEKITTIKGVAHWRDDFTAKPFDDPL